MHNGLPMIDRLKYSFSGLPPYDASVVDTQAGLSRLLAPWAEDKAS